jgi:RecJ-like exonuclease
MYLFIKRFIFTCPKMTKEVDKLAKDAAKLINSFPKGTRIRVVSHYDADGITAAAIICQALYRADYNFHASLMRNPFDKGLERVAKEENELIIFSDMGSGQIETIEKMNSKSIIIDHHQVKKQKTADNVLQINANLCKINGNYEGCGSSLAFALALALDGKNMDLASLAIVGMTGDKQYIGGIEGYNKTVVKKALDNDIVSENQMIKLYGDTIFDSLFYAVDPYYSGLSANKEKIIELLEKLKIDKDTSIHDLSDLQFKKLNSFLMLILTKNNCENNILDTIIRPRYKIDLFDCEAERLADLLDACGKGGNRGLGLSICLGDKDSFDEAVELEKQYKQEILDELLRLEKEGFKGKNSFRYFYSKNSSLGGVIGGIATNYMLDKTKPLISIVRNDDEIHVSCRGNQYLVKKGLDLGVAMSKAAKELDGHGGGHAIASGATLNLAKEDEFLEIVDSIISKQIK